MAQTQVISIPSKLSITEETEEAWKSFKQKVELYELASGSRNRSDEEKVALLLLWEEMNRSKAM